MILTDYLGLANKPMFKGQRVKIKKHNERMYTMIHKILVYLFTLHEIVDLNIV